MENFLYPAKIEEDADGRFWVTFRDIEFAVTDGETLNEAMDEASECLSEALAGIINNNEQLPHPSKTRKGEVLISPDAVIAAKAALYLATKEAGLNKSTLSVRLGVSEAVGRRLLDPRHNTKLVNIDKALRVMGRRLVIGCT
jgi:antitoxin HicB